MDNIFKYVGWFHDGSLDYLEQSSTEIIFWLESCEVDLNQIEKSFKLSNEGTIRGKLHVEDIKSIRHSDKQIASIQLDSWEFGEIRDLEIFSNKILLNLEWYNIENDVSEWASYQIEADEISWENIPTLKMPRNPYIEDYTALFADGLLSKVVKDERTWHLFLESPKISAKDRVHRYLLSSHNTIRGDLRIRHLKCVSINRNLVNEIPPLMGIISKLSISYNQINIFIKNEKEIDDIVIQASYIYWYNF